MNTRIKPLLTALTLLGTLGVLAQTPTFTYQGRLNDTNGPVTGSANLTFRIFPTESGGASLWQETTNAVPVASGLFAVELGKATPIFGPVFDGSDRWLEIAVNGTTLANRQKITHAPYTIRAREAATAVSATTAATVVADGVATASLQDNSVTSGKILDGTVTAADVQVSSFSNTFWKVDGNAGTTAGTHFLGTTDNQPVELRVNNQRVWRISPTVSNATVNLVAGSPLNYIEPSVIAATIAGGGTPQMFGEARSNSVASDFSTVGGGIDNQVGLDSPSGVIGGGFHHRIGNGSADATISGGANNTVASNSWRAVVGGGFANTVAAPESTVAGGALNSALGFSSTVGGGGGNSVSGSWSAIAGGRDNLLTNANYGSIGGGRLNTISSNASYATIGGGGWNVADAPGATIGGGGVNALFVGANRVHAQSGTIGGGYENLINTNASYGTIAGGWGNAIQTNTQSAAIGGGAANTIHGGANGAAIGGGNNNTVEGGAVSAVVGGGNLNFIRRSATAATISGGQGNEVTAAGGTVGGGGYDGFSFAGNKVEERGATIGGGVGNTIATNAAFATIAGGAYNVIQTNAASAVIGGGEGNEIGGYARGAAIVGGLGNRATGDGAFVGGGGWDGSGFSGGNAAMGAASVVVGGYSNIASDAYAVVPGGRENYAAFNAFAAGRRAKAYHGGSFVWADSQNADFVTTANNQFNIRASGGAHFVTAGAGMTLDGQPVFSGTDGSVLTALNASQLTSGTVADARLSANVAQRNATQTFTGMNTFMNKVGIGTNAPASPLTVMTPGAGYGVEHTDGSRRLSTYLDANGGWVGTVSPDPLNLFVANGSASLTIDTSARIGIGRNPTANKLEVEGNASKAAAGSWLANSDARIKQDIQLVTGALEKLEQVRLVSFRYTDAYRENHSSVEDRRYLNVVAQQFQTVFPEHVKTSGERLPDGSEILQVDTYPLTIYSAAAIQELNQNLKQKDTEIAELKHELEKLKQVVDKLANANP